MNDDENLTKIKGLLKSVASSTAPFQSSCSETKILAYTNRDEALDKYRDIAREALIGSDDLLQSQPKCKEKFNTVQQLLEKDRLETDILKALTSLRATYLNEILKPAVKVYLIDGAKNRSEVGKLYEKVFTLDGLIEVAQFFDRVDSI